MSKYRLARRRVATINLKRRGRNCKFGGGWQNALLGFRKIMVFSRRHIEWFTGVALLASSLSPPKIDADPAKPCAARQSPPVHLTAEQDHERIMNLLHITSLRRGADGDRKSPYAANYDESKAGPFTKLPDPRVLKNGKLVTTAKVWWERRRPEIVEDFDREIYGRMPRDTPKVRWEIVSTTRQSNGDVPVIAKKLVGHVDNSSYPQISVNIDLALTTPANATRPVPVMMELSFSPEFMADLAKRFPSIAE